jgi:hypothetical protein
MFGAQMADPVAAAEAGRHERACRAEPGRGQLAERQGDVAVLDRVPVAEALAGGADERGDRLRLAHGASHGAQRRA